MRVNNIRATLCAMVLATISGINTNFSVEASANPMTLSRAPIHFTARADPAPSTGGISQPVSEISFTDGPNADAGAPDEDPDNINFDDEANVLDNMDSPDQEDDVDDELNDQIADEADADIAGDPEADANMSVGQ